MPLAGPGESREPPLPRSTSSRNRARAPVSGVRRAVTTGPGHPGELPVSEYPSNRLNALFGDMSLTMPGDT